MRTGNYLTLAIACAACTRPKPIIFYPEDRTTGTERPTAEHPVVATHPVEKPGRLDIPVGVTPISLLVHDKTLVLTDASGAVLVMPADGSKPPKKLSDQHGVGFAYHVFEAGGHILATAHQGLFEIKLPDGPVTKLAVRGLPDAPESATADGTNAYVSIFKHDDVMKVSPQGGDAQRIAMVRSSVLGSFGSTIYAASYDTGEVFVIAAGGKPTSLVKNLPKPTAVAADATAVYVYCETDETLRRIELATGAVTKLADHLANSDELHLDGPWIYTRSWGKPHDALIRIAKDGKQKPQVLAGDLEEPQGIVVTEDAIYVGNKASQSVVRLDKSQLAP